MEIKELMTGDQLIQQLHDATSMDQLPPMVDTYLGPPDADIGILLIHGLSGSNIEQMYLGHSLAKQGYRVLLPVLPGHGKNQHAMVGVTADLLLEVAVAAMDELYREKDGRRLIIAGHSLGGDLALLLAARQHPAVTGCISLAAPTHFSLYSRIGAAVMSLFGAWYPYASFEMTDEMQLDNVYVRYLADAYSRIPFSIIHQVFRVIGMMEQVLPAITVPILIVQSTADHRVPKESAQTIYDHVGSIDKHMVWLERSSHIIVADVEKEIVLKEMLSFIERLVD